MPDTRRNSNKMPLTLPLSCPVCVYRGASARAPRGVFGALAAAGRGGGRHVERRKSTDPKVPIGTTESSPRFQPWVASGEWPEPRRGDRKDGTGPVRSFVPDGTRFMFAPQPSDKSLGYFRASLRDVESRHAKHVPSALTSHPGLSRRGAGQSAPWSAPDTYRVCLWEAFPCPPPTRRQKRPLGSWRCCRG